MDSEHRGSQVSFHKACSPSVAVEKTHTFLENLAMI